MSMLLRVEDGRLISVQVCTGVWSKAGPAVAFKL